MQREKTGTSAVAADKYEYINYINKCFVISVTLQLGLMLKRVNNRVLPLFIVCVPDRTGRPPSCPNTTMASSFLFAMSFLSTKSSPRSAKAPSGKILLFSKHVILNPIVSGLCEIR